MAFLLCHVLVNTSHFPTILPTNAPNPRKTSRYILKHINTRISPNPLQHRGLGDLTWHEWVHRKRSHGFLVRMRSAVRIRPAAPKRKPPGRVVFLFWSCVAESKLIPVGGKPPSRSNNFRLNRKVWADFAIPVRQERVAAGGVLCYILKCVCGYSLKKARALPLERNHQASAADGLRMYGNRHSLCLPDAGEI